MKFNIYGRFQVEVNRNDERWTVYRSDGGKRSRMADVVIPSDIEGHEVAIFLDDLFHEYARFGETVEGLPE